MADRDSRERIVVDVDSKKTDFWQGEGNLSPIPARLLMQTNWFAYHWDEIAGMVSFRESGGTLNVEKMDEVIAKRLIVFKLPPRGTREGEDAWDNMCEVMFRLRLKQRLVDGRHNRIERLKAEGKDTSYDERRLLKGSRPRPMDDAFINSFLDTLRFEVSETSLNELRYQAPTRRISVQTLREDMDND